MFAWHKKIFSNTDKLPNETEKFCEEFFLSCQRFFERNSQGIKPNSNEWFSEEY